MNMNVSYWIPGILQRHHQYSHCYIYNNNSLLCYDPGYLHFEDILNINDENNLHPSYVSYLSSLSNIGSPNCTNYNRFRLDSKCFIYVNEIKQSIPIIGFLPTIVNTGIGNNIGYVFELISFVIENKFALGRLNHYNLDNSHVTTMGSYYDFFPRLVLPIQEFEYEKIRKAHFPYPWTSHSSLFWRQYNLLSFINHAAVTNYLINYDQQIKMSSNGIFFIKLDCQDFLVIKSIYENDSLEKYLGYFRNIFSTNSYHLINIIILNIIYDSGLILKGKSHNIFTETVTNNFSNRIFMLECYW